MHNIIVWFTLRYQPRSSSTALSQRNKIICSFAIFSHTISGHYAMVIYLRAIVWFVHFYFVGSRNIFFRAYLTKCVVINPREILVHWIDVHVIRMFDHIALYINVRLVYIYVCTNFPFDINGHEAFLIYFYTK